MSSLICDLWLTHKLVMFVGLTDFLECSFSCHDQRSVAAAGLDLYGDPASRGRSLALAAQGLDLWRTSEWGLAGERCGTGWTHGMLRSTSALLRPGTQPIGLKSFNYYPFPRPFTPQCGKTCRPTLPIGTLAEGRHTHTQHTP